MLTPEDITNLLDLPDEWEILRQGVEKNNQDNVKKIYIAISTPDDVITILVFPGYKADECSIEVGWKKIKQLEHHGHTVTLAAHPGGERSHYIWYCPKNNATFMINFSCDLEIIQPILNSIKCH